MIWTSPWMIEFICAVGLVVILVILLNEFCWYCSNRSVMSLMRSLGYRLNFSSGVRAVHPVESNSNRTFSPNENYAFNQGYGSVAQSQFPISQHQNTQNSQSQFAHSFQRSDRPPSGGWNGDYVTVTPSHNHSSNYNSSHSKRSNPFSRNFRADSGFNSLGSDGFHVNIREDLNTFHSHDYSHYNSLSAADKALIDTLSPLASTHNLTLPKWDGARDKYADFRLSFMSFVPTIPVLLRLEALKHALEHCPEALRVIAEFQNNDTDSFSGAILALDYEYDNLVEVVERLTDKIQTLTTTRTHSQAEFVDNINEMTVLITKLSRKDPTTRLTLAPLASEWIKYLPNAVYDKVIKKVQKFGKSWLTFENIYGLCTDSVKHYKITKDLMEKRAAAEKSSFKNSNAILSESTSISSTVTAQCSSDWNPPLNSSFEEKEILYAGTFGKPTCCFCNKESHPSINCPKLSELTNLQIFKHFNDKSTMSENLPKIRCYLCVEQGHSVDQCILIQHNIVPDYQCKCTVQPVHNEKLCQILTVKSNPNQPSHNK